MLPVLAGCDVLPDFRWAVNSAAWTIVPIKITDELLMSALGQKRTLELSRAMSAYSVLLYHLLGELEATGSVQLGEGTHPPR